MLPSTHNETLLKLSTITLPTKELNVSNNSLKHLNQPIFVRELDVQQPLISYLTH